MSKVYVGPKGGVYKISSSGKKVYVKEGQLIGKTGITKTKYPWPKCIADQTKRYGSKEIAKKVCGKIKSKRGGIKVSTPPGTFYNEQQAYLDFHKKNPGVILQGNYGNRK